jgi:tetratricopeptide (TPR) repeat protein
MRARVKISVAALVALVWTAGAAAAASTPMENDLAPIERDWARITYQLHDSDLQEAQMSALAAEAAKLAARYPDRAEPLIWEGIVTSSEAKYAGVFSALGLAKAARELFEKAGRIDYRAVDGAVPTSLGALYYEVPGFPLGFGDNDKARRYLEQGVEISPTGLDSNFFYGDFLYGQGEYAKAASVLKRALAAPPDSMRPVWDAGRRAEIRALLAKVDDKLASAR